MASIFEKWFRVIVFATLMKPFLLLVLGVNVFGREHLNKVKNWQCILVANHNSHLDACVLMHLFPLTRLCDMRPVAAADYFEKHVVLGWFARTILNIIPIPRSGFTKSNNPLTKMGDVLEAGQSLIIFPEGSRGEPEAMAEFKVGVAHLIKKFPDVPVLPVFLRGLGKSLPKGEAVLVPFFCDVVIGAPLSPAGSKEEIVTQVQQGVELLNEVIQELYEQAQTPDENLSS